MFIIVCYVELKFMQIDCGCGNTSANIIDNVVYFGDATKVNNQLYQEWITGGS